MQRNPSVLAAGRRRVMLALAASCFGSYLGAETAWAASARSSEYLQLVFSSSAEDCKARLKRVVDSHRPGQQARCFRNVSDQAGQPPAARKLPPYLLEIVMGLGATPQQPGDASAAITVTFRALGRAQIAHNPDRPDHQPLGSGAVGSYRMYVFTNPTAGQDAAYNDWYDHQHVPDVLNVPGFLTGQRFAMVDPEQHNPVKLPRYLALFELTSRGLVATDAEILARGRDGRTVGSPSFDLKTGVVAYMVSDAEPTSGGRR